MHISTWSSNSDHPCFSEKIDYWWITPMSIRSSFITEQLTGASLLSSYPGQTPCSSTWTLCFRLMCTGNMIHWAVVKRLVKFLCGLPSPSALKLNSPQVPLVSTYMNNIWTKNKWIYCINIGRLIINKAFKQNNVWTAGLI